MSDTKIDQATDTVSIEEFIKDLIRKEFHHLIEEIDDSSVKSQNKSQGYLDRGAANVLDALKSVDDKNHRNEKDKMHKLSRIKINGNNKPLLQITFTRNGENTMQVLDNCVNVTISDSSCNVKGDTLNESAEDAANGEQFHDNSLRRCQGFNALQVTTVVTCFNSKTVLVQICVS